MVKLTNMDPRVVSITPCLVKWRADEWRQKRQVCVPMTGRAPAITTHGRAPPIPFIPGMLLCSNGLWRVQVRVTAVQNYKNDADRLVVLKTEPVISTAEYYKGFDTNDVYIKSQNRATAQCSGTGDPHYTVRVCWWLRTRSCWPTGWCDCPRWAEGGLVLKPVGPMMCADKGDL